MGRGAVPFVVKERALEQYKTGLPVSHIAAEAGVTNSAIAHWVRVSGHAFRRAPRPRGTVRHGAFSILSPESRYWAGVLITDGSIVGPAHNRIKLALHEKDKDLIELFRSFVGATNNPTTYDDVVELRFTSDQMASDLLRLGITPRKSFSAQAHQDLVSSWDFWRGCVDGDGGVYMYKNGPMLCLTGASLVLHDQFCSFLRSRTHVALHDFVNTYRKGDTSTFVTAIHGVLAQRIAERLYRNPVVTLRRKYEQAQRMQIWRSKYNRSFHTFCQRIP